MKQFIKKLSLKINEKRGDMIQLLIIAAIAIAIAFFIVKPGLENISQKALDNVDTKLDQLINE